MSEVLLEITKDHLETGMRGYPVGYCVTSSVDPVKGLFYVGKPVQDLIEWSPESVIFMLYYGREATEFEVKKFKEDLAKRSFCSPEMITSIKKLPRKGHPMKLFCAALLIAGMFEAKGDYREDCLNLIAKIPEIVTSVITHHAGWTQKSSNPDLGYMENFAQMLNPPNVDLSELIPVLKLFNVLHYDHGGGNLSTFVGKAVASGLEDIYGSICAAMCALAGSKHGKANQDCLHFVEGVLAELGEGATAEQVEKMIRKRLQKNELIFGFGHAVLRVEDPRATVLYEYAHRKFPRYPLVKIASLLRIEGTKVLKENAKIADPYPNVDSISGSLLSAAGFHYPEYFTILFGLARVVGISIQIVYERCEAREGKGTPIIRPKYLFKKREAIS